MTILIKKKMNFYIFFKIIKMFVKKFQPFSYKDEYNKRGILINKKTFKSLVNTHYYTPSNKTFYKKDKTDFETEIQEEFQGKRKRKDSINECIELFMGLSVHTKIKIEE
jgi:hypothetical protein